MTARLTHGPLADAYARATGAFLHRIPASRHAQAYVGTHPEGFAESEFAGKYLDTCVFYARTAPTEDERRAARAAAGEVAASIIRNQREDGYLGGYEPGHEYAGFSVWNQAFTTHGLLSFYELTGEAAALSAVRRCVSLLYRHFVTDGNDILDASNYGTQHVSLLPSLVRLARLTGDETAAAFASHIVARLSGSGLDFAAGGDILALQSRKGIENFVILIGLVEYARMSGDDRLLAGCISYFDQVRATQIREDGSGSLRELWYEGGNLPQFLPVDARPSENCVAVGWVEYAVTLFRATGESRFLSPLDRTVYNHLLGALDADGGDFAYYQPNFGRRVTRTSEDAYKCCRYRGYSLVSRLPSFLFFPSEDGKTLTAGLYAAGEWESGAFRVREETDWPFDGHVTLSVTVTEPGAHTLVLRVPADATGASCCFDARSIPARDGAFRVTLPGMGTHTVRLDFTIGLTETRAGIGGRAVVSYARGPILLAAETEEDRPLDGLTLDPCVAKREKTPDESCYLRYDAGGVRLIDYASSGRAPGRSFTVWIPTV